MNLSGVAPGAVGGDRPARGGGLLAVRQRDHPGRAGSVRRARGFRDLRAPAAAHVGSGLLHGFPVSSSGSRTALGAHVELDITAADSLDQLREELGRRGIVFAMARVKQDLRDDLVAAGLVDKVGKELIFPTLPTAVQGYEQWCAR